MSGLRQSISNGSHYQPPIEVSGSTEAQTEKKENVRGWLIVSAVALACIGASHWTPYVRAWLHAPTLKRDFKGEYWKGSMATDLNYVMTQRLPREIDD